MSNLDTILSVLLERGARQYGGEAVSQLAHALQCATLAERAGAPAALVAAALLHDFGHIVGKEDDLAGIDSVHETLGASALAAWFGPEVTEPIRLHVEAKRYLCAAEPDYQARLSPASVRSLALQGGPLARADAAAFAAERFATHAVALRRWDEAAKDPRAETPGLEHFRPSLESCLKSGR